MAEKIRALFIFEILGKPAEHIRVTLEQIIDRLGEQKGIKIINRKVHEPHLVEEKNNKRNDVRDKNSNMTQEKRDEQREEQEQARQEVTEKKILKDKKSKEEIIRDKDLFTTFAEVELNADNLNLIFMIVLNMMPSSVEIVEPADLRLKNFDLSRILSDLTVSLHRFDEIAKALAIERHGLIKKIKELEEKIGKEKEAEEKIGDVEEGEMEKDKEK